MATLTVVTPDITGELTTLVAAAAGGDTFANTGSEYLVVRNAHATLARTVTIDSPATCSFGLAANAAHDAAIVIAALTQQTIGPFPVGRFNTGAGMVVITYSDSAADLTVGVMKPAAT